MAYCGLRGICDIPHSSFFPRIGFVFIINTDDEVDGMNDAGVALWRAFNYIADEHDVSQAFISITHVSLCTRHNFFITYSGFLWYFFFFVILTFIEAMVKVNTYDEFNSCNAQLRYIMLSPIYILYN